MTGRAMQDVALSSVVATGFQDSRDARTLDESVELGRLLTALETEMPPGNCSKHVLDVLHIPARTVQQFMPQYCESQGTP